jgi:glyoxylate/hydroxypyruvate reductase A
MDEYELQQRERRWHTLEAHRRGDFTVGVLGLGVLGSQVARALTGFGVPVRGFSRTEKRIDGVTTFAGEAHFDEFLDGTKVLVNLLPHTPDTEGVLNRRAFDKLARGAYVINLARGPHLVDQDLLDALASGQIAAATLDVFHTEPLPRDHPFWTAPRVTITPHSSAITLREESVVQVAEKIRALSRGETIGGVVDLKRGY